jgi:hypothetical protein
VRSGLQLDKSDLAAFESLPGTRNWYGCSASFPSLDKSCEGLGGDDLLVLRRPHMSSLFLKGILRMVDVWYLSAAHCCRAIRLMERWIDEGWVPDDHGSPNLLEMWSEALEETLDENEASPIGPDPYRVVQLLRTLQLQERSGM